MVIVCKKSTYKRMRTYHHHWCRKPGGAGDTFGTGSLSLASSMNIFAVFGQPLCIKYSYTYAVSLQVSDSQYNHLANIRLTCLWPAHRSDTLDCWCCRAASTARPVHQGTCLRGETLACDVLRRTLGGAKPLAPASEEEMKWNIFKIN